MQKWETAIVTKTLPRKSQIELFESALFVADADGIVLSIEPSLLWCCVVAVMSPMQQSNSIQNNWQTNKHSHARIRNGIPSKDANDQNQITISRRVNSFVFCDTSRFQLVPFFLRSLAVQIFIYVVFSFRRRKKEEWTKPEYKIWNDMREMITWSASANKWENDNKTNGNLWFYIGIFFVHTEKEARNCLIMIANQVIWNEKRQKLHGSLCNWIIYMALHRIVLWWPFIKQ